MGRIRKVLIGELWKTEFGQVVRIEKIVGRFVIVKVVENNNFKKQIGELMTYNIRSTGSWNKYYQEQDNDRIVELKDMVKEARKPVVYSSGRGTIIRKPER